MRSKCEVEREDMNIDENYIEKLIDTVAKTITEAFENVSIEDVNMYKLGYVKAIDDLMNALCDHCMQQTNECYKLECPFCTDGCDIINISEQLKSKTKLLER